MTAMEPAPHAAFVCEDALPLAVLDALPAKIAVLDSEGCILLVNAAWRHFARANGLRTPRDGVGTNYLAACEAGGAPEAAAGIRRILDGSSGSFECEYSCHAPQEQRWFRMGVTPLPGGDATSARPRGAVVRHVEITDRELLARELNTLSRESGRRERMLAGMLAASADNAYAIDRHKRLIYANAATLRIWGLSLAEALGRTAPELGYPPELSALLDAQIETVLRTRKPVTGEMPFTGASGEPACYEYILSPAFADDGSVEFVVGCSRDITQRKRTEEALRASATEFETLAAAMPQIVWSSVDGELTYLNGQWLHYTGRAIAQGLGRGWLSQVHPEDRQKADAAMQMCHAGRDCSIELRMAGTRGQYRWWLLRGVPLKDEQGAILKCLGTFTDVDEMKAAEAEVSRANRELQRQRTELRTLFDLVPAMVWFKDPHGRVLQVNARAAGAMGMRVDEAVGRRISELYPDVAARYGQEDREVIATGKPLLGQIEQVRNADGETRWVLSDKVPYRDESGAMIGLIVMKHDITERKRIEDALNAANATLESRVQERTAQLARAREEAERANRAKSKFLATMSHEIRTPMTGLLGLLELLELTPLDDEQRSTLAVARESGHALKRIIDGILDFSKIEADSLELDVAPSSVRSVVDSLCSLHRPGAAAKGLALRATVAPDVSHELCFDAVRLGQILNNFLSNAIKFTHEGSVDLSVQCEQRVQGREDLRITVRDTGIGIAEDRIGRLFNPFVQADAHTATEFGGTGLGLFIARRLAQLMGGSVQLESRLGVGTSLILRVGFALCEHDVHGLPPGDGTRRQISARVAARVSAPSVEQAVRERRLLLVVDDHPINRMVLMRQAATLGYAADAAADGEEALAKWSTGRYAAVVTDCNMPRMNGLQLAAAIRAREGQGALLRTAIIGCTANATVQAAQECVAAGMDHALTKPVGLDDLYATLERWVPLDGTPQGAPSQSPASAPVPADAASGLLDPALLALVAGTQDAVPGVLESFRSCNEGDAQELRRACAAADFAAAKHFAHRLAGACTMLGASRLGAASAAVENAAKAQEPQALREAMLGFEQEFQALSCHLQALAPV